MEYPLRDKASFLQGVFAEVSHAYDFNNHLHSLWLDQRWRQATVRAARVRRGDAVLDVACGTGDLTAFLTRTEAGRIVGLDFCPEMLAVARRKVSDPRVQWVLGDAMNPPFADESFDVVASAFGVRNLTDARTALGQFHRVLRPGGRLLVLDFAGGGPYGRMRGPLQFYVRRVMPVTAGLVAGKRAAYDYLPVSIASFATPGELSRLMCESGFDGVTTRMFAFGMAALHVAKRS